MKATTPLLLFALMALASASAFVVPDDFKFRNIPYQLPSLQSLTATYKLAKAAIDVSGKEGELSLAFNDNLHMLTASDGLLLLSGLKISDADARNLDFALQNHFGEGAYVGSNNGNYAIVFRAKDILKAGFASNTKVEDNMMTWVFTLINQSGSGITLRLSFEPEHLPARTEFGSLYSKLGFGGSNRCGKDGGKHHEEDEEEGELEQDGEGRHHGHGGRDHKHHGGHHHGGDHRHHHEKKHHRRHHKGGHRHHGKGHHHRRHHHKGGDHKRHHGKCHPHRHGKGHWEGQDQKY